MAMVAAGFTGGEAEELRRAMGFKRSMERMGSIEERLRAAWTSAASPARRRTRSCSRSPRSRSTASPNPTPPASRSSPTRQAWLKAHHPTAFLLALLNAWPMGFYHPATLVKDAQRHGVKVRPVDVTKSDWRCTWEPRESEVAREENPDRRALIDQRTQNQRHQTRARRPPAGSVRVGLRYVRGLKEDAGRRIEEERRKRPFHDLDDLALRCRLGKDQLDRLAWAGALAGLGLERREASWQVARVARDPGPLFRQQAGERGTPLRPMTALENTVADFQGTSLTVGHHPMAFARARLKSQGVVTCAELERLPAGRTVRYAGSVIVRQRPGTAKGMLFVTLEDETGMAQALVTPDLLAEHRDVIVGAAGLVIEGRLQRKDGSMSVKAECVWPIDHLDQEVRVPSHDWH